MFRQIIRGTTKTLGAMALLAILVSSQSNPAKANWTWYYMGYVFKEIVENNSWMGKGDVAVDTRGKKTLTVGMWDADRGSTFWMTKLTANRRAAGVFASTGVSFNDDGCGVWTKLSGGNRWKRLLFIGIRDGTKKLRTTLPKYTDAIGIQC